MVTVWILALTLTRRNLGEYLNPSEAWFAPLWKKNFFLNSYPFLQSFCDNQVRLHIWKKWKNIKSIMKIYKQE